MNAAKLRDFYQQSQLILSELQAVGADAYGRDITNAKHQNLVCLAVRLKLGADSMTDKDSRAIWTERSSKLHHDLLTLTALCLQGDGQSADKTWDSFVGLLYAGAVTYLALEKDCADLKEEIAAQMKQEAVLEERTKEIVKQKEVSTHENLELRTRVVVQQQALQQRGADARELQQHWQAVVSERDRLRVEKETLAQEFTKSARECDRQTVVIKQLMERSESSGKERESAVVTLTQVDEDNHVLRVNLHQHTLVVEKLIGLNSEMMETANSKTLLCEQLRLELKRRDDNNKVASVNTEEPPPNPLPSESAHPPLKEDEEAVPLSHPPLELSSSQKRYDANGEEKPPLQFDFERDPSRNLSTPESSATSSQNGSFGWGPRYWAQVKSRPEGEAVRSSEAHVGEEGGGAGNGNPPAGSSCSSTNEEPGSPAATSGEEPKSEVGNVPRERDADSVENHEAAAAIAKTYREASPSETRSESGPNLASASGGEEEGDATLVEEPKGPSRLKANLYVAKGLVRNVGGKAKGWMRYIAGDG